jgi:transposase InsO family protein
MFPRCYVLTTEFRGRALAAWSEERGVRLEFIQPGKPVQNAYVESFNDSIQEGSRQPRLHDEEPRGLRRSVCDRIPFA